MKIAILTTDNREQWGKYSLLDPCFGTAPEALLQGFAQIPEAEVHVLSCARKVMKSPEKLASNIWFHSLHAPRIGWTASGFQGCIRAVRRKLKQIKPDIVHGQGTERDCALDAVFSGFPNVLTIHGNMAELARLFKAPITSYAWLAAQLENIALKRTQGVFCNSEYTEGLVRPRTAKTWRVSNPIREFFFDAPRSKPPDPGKCILVNIGIISERKRQNELLDVMRRLHEQGLRAEMQFIGHFSASEYSNQFKQRIRKAETQGYARHLGFKEPSELIACFDAAHGLVHFPSEEAFGLVVAEGMARELKFFGSRLGGIKDIANGAPGAELYDGGDWNGLTAGIARWIKQGHPKPSGLIELMRERYHPERIARRHIEIYQEVLENRRKTAIA